MGLKAFMGVAWMARVLVNGGLDAAQYVGGAIYVLAEAIGFAPLIIVALITAGPTVLFHAILLSGALFLGLSAMVFTTKRDFSFLRSVLIVAGGAILYDTSRILKEHKPDEYVSAALELFASMALLL